jgi:hypothetical protein
LQNKLTEQQQQQQQQQRSTATMSSTKTTIPVKYEFEGSLRRTTIEVPPRMQQLRNKLANSYPQFAHLFKARDNILRLKYVDDEGDEITITTNEELEVAYRVAQDAGKVLRFTVPSFESNTATRVTSESEAEALSSSESSSEEIQVDTTQATKATGKAAAMAIKTQKRLEKQLRKRAKAEFRATKAARKAEMLARKAAQKATRIADIALRAAAQEAARQLSGDAQQSENEQAQVIHFGVTCDRSGMSPIVGPRFHKRGENYDICLEEYEKITDPNERALFVRYDRPVTFSDWGRCGRGRRGRCHGGHATNDNDEVVHRGITCDRSKMKPIRGIRYHKRGADYDLCEAEFNKSPDEAEKAHVRI